MPRCVLFAGLLLAGLSACGSTNHPRSERPSSPSAALPAGGRFDATITAIDRTRSVSFHSRGSFDRANDRVAVVLDLTAVDAELGLVEVRVVDGVTYVASEPLARTLGASTRWISARGSIDEVVDVALVDPRRWLERGGDDTQVDVGADGLVRAITMRFDSAREGGSAVVTVRYYDVGIPMSIEPPPPDEVTVVTARGG